LVRAFSDQQLQDMIEVLTQWIDARARGESVPPLIDLTPEPASALSCSGKPGVKYNPIYDDAPVVPTTRRYQLSKARQPTRKAEQPQRDPDAT
jgi:hypothetical protein